MAERLNLAHATSLAGAVITTVGAVNLDKRWGAPLVVVGRIFDAIDGPIARANGTDGETGRLLDIDSDRIAEAAIVVGLVMNNVVPAYVPVVGYGLKMASQARKGQERSMAGNAAMMLKDAALGAVLLSTVFEKGSKPNTNLKSTFQVLGGVAMFLGIKEVFTETTD